METRDLKLDGNAIGGLLLELFGVELTASACVCGSCGAQDQMACLDVYVNAPASSSVAATVRRSCSGSCARTSGRGST